jgi:ABC-type sugar transport system ATPase subunit
MSRLSVHDVHFSRAGRPVLAGVNFEHDAGAVLTLLGPSGSGKTTLLWLLAGLLRPDRGRIDYGGDNRLGFVFQDGALWEHLTVRAHLDIVLSSAALSRRDRAERVSRTLDDTGLAKLAKRRPGELSGGERQRLALARALVIEPQWLFLDEPTSQLDGPARQEMIELLDRSLRSTRAGVVLATHQVDLAMRLSHRIGVLLDARVAQIAPPVDVFERPVSLAVARLLGPASELREGGGTAIVRPHDVSFAPDAAGAFTTRACYFAGGQWHVEVMNGGEQVVVASDAPVPPGVKGRVTRSPRAASRFHPSSDS